MFLFSPLKSLRDEGTEKFPTYLARQCVVMVVMFDSRLCPHLWDSGVILYQHAIAFSADIHSIKCLCS